MDWPGGAENRHGSGFPAMPLTVVHGRAASVLRRSWRHIQRLARREPPESTMTALQRLTREQPLPAHCALSWQLYPAGRALANTRNPFDRSK
jgi:hypothetical protein